MASDMIQLELTRSRSGLTVLVKVHPSIEEYMKSLGTGSTCDVRSGGRYWIPPKDGVAVYDSSTNLGVISITKDIGYRLDHVGHPLLEADSEYRRQTVNLSLLRCVGASSEAGVTFGVRGVFSNDMVREIGDLLKKASHHFYISYMKPVKVIVSVSAKAITPNEEEL